MRSNQLSYRPKREISLKIKQQDKMSVYIILRKEVIQPHLPIRLPCYDFTPIIDFTLDGWLPKVTPPALGTSDFRGVTGGVYKARERIHRSMLTCDY